MKRICSIITMLTIIALFNMGGCGGSDNETNGFKPVIDRIIFYENSDKIKQVQSYTQGSEGVVEITISDYDLNAQTIEIQINQCADASCNVLTPNHGPNVYNLSQTSTRFTYTFPDMGNIIQNLKATCYYQFVFEVMDSNGQSTVSHKIVQINKGFPPEIYELYFYKDEPGDRLDTWSYYNSNRFVAELKAKDIDRNAKYIYIKRTYLGTNVPPNDLHELGPIELNSDDTQTDEMTITLDQTFISQKTSESTIFQKLTTTGLYEITITLEDAPGNTAEISRNITITN